eukprot:6161480-Pyramimonas_sp.AAC.1
MASQGVVELAEANGLQGDILKSKSTQETEHFDIGDADDEEDTSSDRLHGWYRELGKIPPFPLLEEARSSWQDVLRANGEIFMKEEAAIASRRLVTDQ